MYNAVSTHIQIHSLRKMCLCAKRIVSIILAGCYLVHEYKTHSELCTLTSSRLSIHPSNFFLIWFTFRSAATASSSNIPFVYVLYTFSILTHSLPLSLSLSNIIYFFCVSLPLLLLYFFLLAYLTNVTAKQ